MPTVTHYVNSVIDQNSGHSNSDGFSGGSLQGLKNGGEATFSSSSAFRAGTLINLAQLYLSEDFPTDIDKLTRFELLVECKSNYSQTGNYADLAYNAKVDGGRYVNPAGTTMVMAQGSQIGTSWATQTISLGTDWSMDELQAGISFRLGVYLHSTIFYYHDISFRNIRAQAEYTLKRYTLTLTATEGGTVSGAGTYDSGTVVTLQAIPQSGYRFVRWSDGNTNAARTITMTANSSYTAYFEPVSKLYIGTTRAAGVYFGTQKAAGVYIGTTKVL